MGRTRQVLRRNFSRFIIILGLSTAVTFEGLFPVGVGIFVAVVVLVAFGKTAMIGIHNTFELFLHLHALIVNYLHSLGKLV